MRARRATAAIASGLLVTLGVGGGLAASAATKTSSATACVSHTGVLSLLSHGKCAAHTTKVVIGARGPRGVKGAAGKRGVDGNGPAYFVPTQTHVFTSDMTAQDAALATLSLPAGSYAVTATGYVSSTASSGFVLGSCSLYQGAVQKVLTDFDESPSEFPVAVTGAFTSSAPMTLSLHCFKSGPSQGFAAHGTVVATKVTTVIEQDPQP